MMTTTTTTPTASNAVRRFNAVSESIARALVWVSVATFGLAAWYGGGVVLLRGVALVFSEAAWGYSTTRDFMFSAIFAFITAGYFLSMAGIPYAATTVEGWLMPDTSGGR